MDNASNGLAQGPTGPPPGFDPSVHQPFDRGTALTVLRRADELLDESEPEQALTLYGRVISAPERDIAAAGLYGAGNALYRLDREAEAVQAWERATAAGETPVTYRAWRQVAAARVRAGDLRGAIDAYRQCERRAPAEDRAEIASRLGWLSKETGNAGAAGRYFSRSRGDAMAPYMTLAIIGLTTVVSIAAMSGGTTDVFGNYVPSALLQQLMLDKPLVAQGEYYRLISVTLVHDPLNILHLLFNMYALYYAGLLTERLYGSSLMLVFYVLCGIAASTASFALGGPEPAVGASGAIFGLFGVVLVAVWLHRSMLSRAWSAVATQIFVLILINLAIGLSGALPIDNFAHLGGLAAGLWLGLIIPPGRVPTLAAMWQQQRASGRPWASVLIVRLCGVAALLGVIGCGLLVGQDRWATPAASRASVVEPALSGQVVAPGEGVQDAVHVAAIEAGAVGRPRNVVPDEGEI
jgi:membrane associated rhomboid family serine protease